MTHYLRSRHDAICVGVGTAVADDPGLNCRLAGLSLARQPRPVVVDPHARWQLGDRTKVIEVARSGLGLAPFVVTCVSDPPPRTRSVLERHGGKFIILHGSRNRHPQDHHAGTTRLAWQDILTALYDEGLRSVMVEGGGSVINSLLDPACHALIDSVIVTIAPTWLGQGGVVVSPDRTRDGAGHPVPAARLTDVSWHPFGEDVVLCGKISH